MKKAWLYILLAIFLATSSAQKQPQKPEQKRYTVDEIRLSAKGDSTFIQITTNAKPDAKKFIIENPPRLVVDLFGGIVNLPKSQYRLLPAGIITSIRAAQHVSKPTPITRIVFDLADVVTTARLKITPTGVKLSLHTPHYPEFSGWSSGRLAPAPIKPEKAAKETTITKPKPAEAPKESLLAVSQPVESLFAAEGELEPEIAKFLKPETLIFEAVSEEKDTITLARYVRNLVVFLPPKKDPFAMPERHRKIEFGKEPIPFVEELTLVGVVKSGNVNMAIMQDQVGYSYILAPGDTVENGNCIEVNDTSAVFRVVEFGQARRVVIPLKKVSAE
ncbi:AMIN domain-containing protein [bacterium]|nr:AMIN domain-containing protein [bacterium]